METMACVFTRTETADVFWGSFANVPDAHTAIEKFCADNYSWKFEDFTVQQFAFGVLL